MDTCSQSTHPHSYCDLLIKICAYLDVQHLDVQVVKPINQFLLINMAERIEYPAVDLCHVDPLSEVLFAKQNFNFPGFVYLRGKPIDVWRKITSSKDDGYYELIRSTSKVKLFFDIDESVPTFFFPYVSQQIRNVLNVEEEHLTLSCSRPSKESAHIIYYNVVFENIDILRFFIKQYLVAIHHIIDQSVYSKNRLFRCYRSRKSPRIPPFTLDKERSSPLSTLISSGPFTYVYIVYLKPITCDDFLK